MQQYNYGGVSRSLSERGMRLSRSGKDFVVSFHDLRVSRETHTTDDLEDALFGGYKLASSRGKQ